jgi:hypothetical protein
MLDYSEVEAPQGIKACWICGHTMELGQIESVAWGPNAFGEPHISLRKLRHETNAVRHDARRWTSGCFNAHRGHRLVKRRKPHAEVRYEPTH